MKNVEQTILNLVKGASSTLMIAVLAMMATTVKADIIDLTATVEGGYRPGTTTTVLIDVRFDSNTAEAADFIEFSTSGPIVGLSLWHGVPSPSPYQGCGLNKGMEMTGTGPGWGTPMTMAGNSQCGAFEPGEVHTFGIEVLSDGSFTGSFGIQVRIVGDGLGQTGASELTTEVTVQPIVCTIMCPQDVVQTAPNSSCSVNLNIPGPTLTGMCGSGPAPVSATFPVGDTEVVYTAQDANGNEISCVTLVTVIDDEDPFVLGNISVVYDLGPGECSAPIPQLFTVNENCTDPARTITQNEDIGSFDAGYNCVGGPTKYLRVFNAADEDINTELVIEEISFGVLESFGNPFVTVNIYRVDGALSYANMELIASGNDVLPNFEDALYSIPVTAVIGADETFAVEIVVPGSQFNGIIMAMNQGGESEPSYVASDFCGISEPQTLASQGYPGYATVMLVEGYETSYVLIPMNGSLELGDDAPGGVTQVNYIAVDASGNEAVIDFTVTVNLFDGAISAIVCNDEIQVSLDDNCEAIVTADLILEGGPYGCFDGYTVEVEDMNGVSYGNVMTAENIGQELIVRVTGPNNNSCWGKLIVEDKNPAPLECMDISTTCTGDIFPGSPISDLVTFPANLNQFNENISDDGVSSNIYSFSVNGLVRSTITKIAIRLNVEHTSVSDLSATLAGPDGTTVTLFIEPGTDCEEDNLQITLDDDAFNTYMQLEDTCATDMTNAISGIYQPQQLLNIFNGKDPNGEWILTIADTKDGDGGTVVAAELVISQEGGIVSFPTMNDILFQTEGSNVYTVMGIDACGPASLAYNDEEIDQDCSSPYSNVIQRTWSAEDAYGNVSEGCIQTIYVFRNGLATLTFPPNYDDLQEPSLSCTLYADEAPGTDVTGGPSGELCDNVQIFPYTDTRIDICEGSYKLIRHFQLLEWCSGEVVEHNQIIKVLDKEGPQIDPVPDVTISAGEFECAGDYVGVFPEVVFDCSDEFTYELWYLNAYDNGEPPTDVPYYSDNTTITANAAIVRGLSFGRTWAQWRISDECGNTTIEYFTITVEDQVNPIAVCDEFTVVSLGSDGRIEVFATTFDDGSIDNCGILEMRARKMTNTCASTNTQFADRVIFCCEEVGQTIMVAFEVTDLSGNKNTCMVEVKVDDKLPPYITVCPPDITLDCQADFSDPAVTGEPVYIDNCEVVAVDFVDNINIDNCGAGEVRRTWTVEDRQGFKATCVQVITLMDMDPFLESDIVWPRDYDATTCDSNLDPENLPLINGFPRYDDDNCSLVATVYEDRVFTFVDGACEKILREWTVIDWCTYNESAPLIGEGYYKHLQVIKLKNTEAPMVSNCFDTTLETFGACEGPVTFTLEATDDCTPEDEIVFLYQIDLFDDGITALDFNLNGTSSTINATLPVGKHTVKWTVEDKCGNATVCDMGLEVIDGKKPTPYCLSSITTVVMNNNGMIEIWANDFDLGSYDNCTPQEDLFLSFSQNVADSSRTFTCAHMPDGVEEEIQIELWVTDAQGNQDFCSISLILQDSQDDACEGDVGTFASISGTMITEDFDKVEGVNVAVLNPSIEIYDQVTTNSQGEYYATQLPKANGYMVKASKNDDVNNGVSTLDLVLIQRHLLGLTAFTSPYQVIASDINNDGVLKSSDLLALRKVILGIITEFPNGQESWRFMPKGTEFADPMSPFPFAEEINVGNLQFSSINNDMMSVKIGDVNGSVNPNLKSERVASTRYADAMTFVVDDIKVNSGTVEIPVYAAGIDEIVGYQFTMNLAGAEFVGVQSGQIDVSNENFATIDDAITTSWSDAEGVLLNDVDPLFVLTLEVASATTVADLLSMNSDIVNAEAYDAAYEVYSATLVTRSSKVDAESFALFQNRPNPFLESTTIKFFLPEATEVELLITDVTGRLITKKVQSYPAGNQSVEINYADLQASGVLYYTIKAGEYTATKKMISLK